MALLRNSKEEPVPHAVTRRALLTLSEQNSKRTLELSCEGLYMRCADARSATAKTSTQSGTRSDEGEPSLAVTTPSMAELLATLDRELGTADVLLVHEPEWLASLELGHEVETRIEAFRRRGGEVRFADKASVSQNAGTVQTRPTA